ncbi:YsnF/AvaK domain-containing protein [Streptomonospora litoralis]|uniref:Uncharacterized protein n=1 Tax=Streptomonospora litoralis TaxID=2498135 RepID=A0A4P6Q5D7_9ACTN|nr:YsnF/AvaK domain-containing protein [Streptomonospora litoralis]QBI55895.1 hypothetical protein EKD16_20680 [Streptomonospora litoralis]
MTTQMGASGLVGHRMLDSDGSNVGKIGQVYYDDETDVPKWVTVRTGLFGSHESFVPLQGSRTVEQGVQVPHDKQTIKDAPHFDVGQHISVEEERSIYQHYDMPYPGVPGPRGSQEDLREAEEGGSGRHAAAGAGAMSAQPDTATPTGTGTTAESGTAAETGATAAGAGGEEASMTRSEEQVHVGAERDEGEHLHLRKHVDTEEFQETVPVTHEEVTVEREPVESAEMGDTRMEPEDQEITLHEEHATVSKESVPVERVRVRKHEVTEDQAVHGERRKERVELEEDEEPPSSEPGSE